MSSYIKRFTKQYARCTISVVQNAELAGMWSQSCLGLGDTRLGSHLGLSLKGLIHIPVSCIIAVLQYKTSRANYKQNRHFHLRHPGRNPPHSPSQFCHCNKNHLHQQPSLKQSYSTNNILHLKINIYMMKTRTNVTFIHALRRWSNRTTSKTISLNQCTEV